MKTPTPLSVSAQRRTPRIELDTPIRAGALLWRAFARQPYGLAALASPLGSRTHRRANTVYAHNPRFRRIFAAGATKGARLSWTFARHWLAGLVSGRVISHLPAPARCFQPRPAVAGQTAHLSFATQIRTQKMAAPARRRLHPTPQYGFALPLTSLFHESAKAALFIHSPLKNRFLRNSPINSGLMRV